MSGTVGYSSERWHHMMSSTKHTTVILNVVHPEKCMYRQVIFSNVVRTRDIIKVSILWS